MKLTRCSIWRQHTRQNFIILNCILKVLLETFVGHLCVSFKKNNYDSLPESRNALLLDMQRSTWHDCTNRSVICNRSGQEWLGILQLLPKLFKHLKCNRLYCSLKRLFLCFAGLFPADQLSSLMQQHPKKIQTNIVIPYIYINSF